MMIIIIIIIIIMGRDSSVGIATRYGLDGAGIEYWYGLDFPHRSRPALWNYPHYYTMGTVSFLGGRAVGAWR